MTDRDPQIRIDELLARNSELLFEVRDERRKNAALETSLREMWLQNALYVDELSQLLAESMGYPLSEDGVLTYDIGRKSLLAMVMEACLRLQMEGEHV